MNKNVSVTSEVCPIQGCGHRLPSGGMGLTGPFPRLDMGCNDGQLWEHGLRRLPFLQIQNLNVVISAVSIGDTGVGAQWPDVLFHVPEEMVENSLVVGSGQQFPPAPVLVTASLRDRVWISEN